ncbi:sugar transporter [Sphingobium lignivorans]|uniref:CHASE2 domain-containing sensor protein n=1 Tax=Sphingobium lignivorans TaxID=2735886 RepID=A0ABR6NFP4_9SPHN|nr:sugar transporter [Sphingobium lignivorans]MBB5986099.1 CHASE2 domain-containing sensor protein [Sphingobium lignivorans]
MEKVSQGRAPIWPAILFLLWNLLGCAAFVMQSTMDLDALAATDPVQAQIWATMPAWAWAAYLVAVAAGTLGAIALLMRSRLAVLLSLLCVAAVLVQFGYAFLGTDLLALKGPSSAIFPAIIVLLAIAQWIYARWLRRRGALR